MQRLDSVPQWCRTRDLSSVQTMKTHIIHSGALHNTAAFKATPTVTRDGAAVEGTTLLIDWLVIVYIALLYRASLRSLKQTDGARMWLYVSD